MIENSMYNNSGLLVNNWYAAGLVETFTKSKPTQVVIFEIPLVIWQLKNGEFSVLLDRCNHRNAPLSKGKVIDNCLVCPYHGWSYNQNGQCVDIPSEGPHRERIPNKKVKEFYAKVAHGLLWVWMGKDNTPNKEPFNMPKFDKDGWRNYYMVTHFKNNVTNLVENFMDVPHTIFVHKGWFRDKKQMAIKANIERTKDSVLISYDQSKDSISFSGWLVNPKGLPMTHTDNFYMPNNTRVDYLFGEAERGFIITSTCTPINPLESMVYTLITYKFGLFNFIAGMVLPPYTRKVINQDVWIMEEQGKSLQLFKDTDYKSTQADTMHLFIESLRNWEQNNHQGVEPKPTIKAIEFWV